MSDAWPPKDTDPEHIAIMRGLARDIVMGAAEALADATAAKVGDLLLDFKTENLDLRARLRVLEEAIQQRKATP